MTVFWITSAVWCLICWVVFGTITYLCRDEYRKKGQFWLSIGMDLTMPILLPLLFVILAASAPAGILHWVFDPPKEELAAGRRRRQTEVERAKEQRAAAYNQKVEDEIGRTIFDMMPK